MAKRKPTGGRLLRRRRMRKKKLNSDCEWIDRWFAEKRINPMVAIQKYYELDKLYPVSTWFSAEWFVNRRHDEGKP